MDWLIRTIFPQSKEEDWVIWQKNQPESHFESCITWTQYSDIHKGKVFIPKSSVVKQDSQNYYRYCFGDYANLVICGPLDKEDESAYYRSLIGLYEVGKGPLRIVKGETNEIKKLRDAVKDGNFRSLAEIDFKSFKYDYNKIHAHTVVSYCLSRLIMFLVSNALFWTYNDPVPHIEEDLCRKSCENTLIHKNFYLGEEKIKRTEPINMKARENTDNLLLPKSWSSSKSPKSWPSEYRCEECKKKKDAALALMAEGAAVPEDANHQC